MKILSRKTRLSTQLQNNSSHHFSTMKATADRNCAKKTQQAQNSWLKEFIERNPHRKKRLEGDRNKGLGASSATQSPKL